MEKQKPRWRQKKHMVTSSELHVARARVGATPDDHLAWLADFADYDLSAEPQRQEARAEITAFYEHVLMMPQPDLRFAVILDYMIGPQNPAPGDLSFIQRKTRERLAHLRTGGIPVSFVGLDSLVALPAGRESGLQIVFAVGDDPEERFWAAVAVLLLRLPELRFCKKESCARPFVPHRAWQHFCSANCGNANRQLQHRRKVIHGKHPRARIGRLRQTRKGGNR